MRLGMALLVGTCLSALAWAQEPQVFKLQKVPTRSIQSDSTDLTYVRQGARCLCTTQPATSAKALGGSVSPQALFGEFTVDREPGTEGSGTVYKFIVDRAEGPNYDRLYVDMNLDGDPTNDPPAGPGQQPALEDRSMGSRAEEIHFADISLPLEGAPEGVLPLSAKLVVYRAERYILSLTPRDSWKGRIQIGRHDYEAVLGQGRELSSRYDSPAAILALTEILPGGRRHSQYWWGSGQLSQMRCVDGTWYSFSAAPTGETLTVHPYGGDVGVLRVEAGGRVLKLGTTQPARALARPATRSTQRSDAESQPSEPVVAMSGSLASKDVTLAVGVFEGERERGEWPKPTQEILLPAGDYYPVLMQVRLGRLDVEISNNYHADGEPRSTRLEPAYGIQIRRDRPFVLDFSGKPDVLFASPAKSTTVRPGQEVQVKAVLIDPKLDVMIRGLDDVSRTVQVTSKDPDGREFPYEKKLSLDPQVTITDSAGQVVASGVMPFG